MINFEFNVNVIGIGRCGIDVANYIMYRNQCIKNVVTLASDEDNIFSQTEDKYNSFYNCKLKLFEFENTQCFNVIIVDASKRYECSLAGNVCEMMAMMNKPCMCIAVMPIKVGEIYYNAMINLDQIDSTACAVVRLENKLYRDVCDVVFRIIYSFAECLDDYAIKKADYNYLMREMHGKYLFTSGIMDDFTNKDAAVYIINAFENYAPFKRCDLVNIFAEVSENASHNMLNTLANNFLSENDFAEVNVYAHSADEHAALEGIISIFARI